MDPGASDRRGDQLRFALKGDRVLTSGGSLSSEGMAMNKRHSREKAQGGTSRSFCFGNPVGWHRD